MAKKQTTGQKRLREFVDALPDEEFKPGSMSLESVECFEKLTLAISRKADATAVRERQGQETTAKLQLLHRITGMTVCIVVVNTILLGCVVAASIFWHYNADAWLVRLLASGPTVAIIGMLTTIVLHYWPRTAPGKG